MTPTMTPTMQKWIRRGLELAYLTVIWLQFWLTALAIQFSFRSYFGDEGKVLPEVVFLLWDVLTLLLIYQSASFTFRLARVGTHTAYLREMGERPFSVRAELPRVLRDRDLWVELGAMLAFVLLMGGTIPFDSLTRLLLPWTSLSLPLRWLINIPILSLLLFASALWAHVSVRWKWHLGRKAWLEQEKHNPLKGYLWALVKVPFVYSLSTAMLVIVIKVLYPIFIMVWRYLLLLLAVVLLLVLFYIAFAYGRAFSKRRRFLSELQTLCTRIGAGHSPLHASFRSILHMEEGTVDFTVHHNGRRYDCKLIAGLYYSVPLYLDDSGRGVFRRSIVLFRREVMQWTTEFRFSFEADGEASKLLILVPTPKRVFLTGPFGKPLPIDTGDFSRDYQIFTATGFLGALERDCIGRRANT